MKNICLYISTIIIFSLTALGSLHAMPPHPDFKDAVDKSARPIPEGSSGAGSSMQLFSSPSYPSHNPPPPVMRVPVILIQFKGSAIDLPFEFYPKRTPEFFSGLLQGDGMTMQKYYLDMSQGNLTVEFDVFGPYTAENNIEYYGENTFYNGYKVDKYAATLVAEAVHLAKSEELADFSVYSKNDQGYLDTVIIIHSGPGEEVGANSNTIWSHYYTLSAAKAVLGDGEGKIDSYDGVTIDRYTIQPEYVKIESGIPITTIGVLCHEFGHVLGLPDLYDTSDDTDGVGLWSLMSGGSWGGGGVRPAPLLAWERYRIGGAAWLNVEEISAGATGVDLYNIDATANGIHAYKIPLGSPGQYLMLEGKEKDTDTGWYVPASGLLITQINENIISKYSPYNAVNSGYDSVHGVNIIEAKSAYYDNAGRGTLWNIKSSSIYSPMPFSAATRSWLAPSSSMTASSSPVIMFLFIILFLPALIIKIKNGKFRLAAAMLLPALLALSSCPSPGDGISYPLVSHPNTNFYKSEDIYSKTGTSGVSITNISSGDSFPMTFDADLP